MSISPPPFKRRRLSSSPTPLPKFPSPPSSSVLAHDKSPVHKPQTPAKAPLSIYSWNINGLAPFLPSSRRITNYFLSTTSTPEAQTSKQETPSLRANLRRWNWPEIVCLQELKVAPTDTTSLSRLRRAINVPLDDDDDDPERWHYDAWFCLPSDRFNAKGFGGKVYGVAILVRRDLLITQDARVRSVDWDLEGRVLLVELERSRLVVMCVYAVNGTSNPYRCPRTGEAVGTRHDRKRVFHRLLAAEIAGYESHDWGVVVAGDMNVARTPRDACPALRMQEEHVVSRRDFEERFMKPHGAGGLGMVDSFRAVRGAERKLTYRPRERKWGTGGDRVDLVLFSGGLGRSLVDADVLDSETERGGSDHVPLFVTVDLGRVREGCSGDDEKGGQK